MVQTKKSSSWGTSDCTVCEIIAAEDWVSLWVVEEVDKDDEDEGVSDGF